MDVSPTAFSELPEDGSVVLEVSLPFLERLVIIDLHQDGNLYLLKRPGNIEEASFSNRAMMYAEIT